MDIESAVNRATKGQTLLHNSDFFKSYYKKTEKIVCAVLYILSSRQKNSETDLFIRDIEKTSQSLIDTSIRALSVPEHQAGQTIESLAEQLLGYETKLRLLAAANLLDRELLFTVLAETDLVLRFLSDYRHRVTPGFSLDRPDRLIQTPKVIVPRRKDRTAVGGASLPAAGTSFASAPEVGDRKGAITAFLQGKGPVSIKDISAVMTDCSEKTIQRSLNELIKDGIVLRSGDRRWSKYNLI